MALFPSATKAQAQGFDVKCSLFVLFDFLTTPIRVWEGDGPLERESQTWEGMGHRQDGFGNPLQAVDGLEQAINGSAQQLTLTLSGVDPRVVSMAQEDVASGEIEGRKLTVWIGFCRVDIRGLAPLDSLVKLGTWIMQRPGFNGQGTTQRSITLQCETLFAQRSRAPNGMLTDRDQQRRYPGDIALVGIPKMVDRSRPWPRA